MTISAVTQIGTALSSGNNQASLAITTSAAAEVGRLVVVSIALDNNGTSDGAVTDVSSVTDSAGNIWERAVEYANGSPGSQAGATVAIWWTIVRTQIANGGTITATFTVATTTDATAMSAMKATLGAGFTVRVAATNSADGQASLDAATPNVECLRVRAVASESNSSTALTPTGGGWAIITQAISGAGITATEMGIRGEWLVSTGTGGASAPTGGAGAVDHASAYAAFQEVAPVDGYQRPLAGPTLRKGLTAAVIAAGCFWSAFTPPVAEAPGTGTSIPYQIGGLPPQVASFQYQSVHGPVPVVVAGETVTVDKWFAPLEEPVRRVRVTQQDSIVEPVVVPPPSYDWYATLARPTRRTTVNTPSAIQHPVPVVAVGAGTPGTGTSVPYSTGGVPPQVRSFQYQSVYGVTAWLSAPVLTWTGDTFDNTPDADLTFDSSAGAGATVTIEVDNDSSFTSLYTTLSHTLTSGEVLAELADLVWTATPLADGTWYMRAKITDGIDSPWSNTETITIDFASDGLAGWFRPLSLPTPPKKLNAAVFRTVGPTAPIVVAETVTIDKWFAAPSQPTRRIGLGVHEQVASVAPVFVPLREFGWFAALGEPTRRKTSVASQAALSWPSGEVVTHDKWFAALSQPVRRVAERRQAYAMPAFVPDLAFDWFSALSAPPKPKTSVATASHPALAWSGHTPPSSEVVSVDKWFASLSDPVRVRPRLAAGSQQHAAFVKATPFEESVTVDRWLMPLSAPTRRVTSVADRLAAAAPVFVPGLAFDWFRALAEPPKAKASVRTASQPSAAWNNFTPPSTESILVDKWFSPFGLPVRDRRLTTASQTASVAPVFVPALAFDWFSALDEPPKSRTSVQAASQLFAAWNNFTPPSTEVISVDKWFTPFGLPVRDRRLATSSQVASVAPILVPEPAFGWFVEFGQPTRRKTSVASQPSVAFAPTTDLSTAWYAQLAQPTLRIDRHQSSIAAPVFVPALAFDWFEALSEPPKAKAGVLTASQKFSAWSAFTPPSTEDISVDKWFAPFGLPVRDRRLTTGSQTAYVAPVLVPAPSFGWFVRFNEPTRRKVGVTAPPSAFAPTFVPALAFDWFRTLSEPPKPKTSVRTASQQFSAWSAFTPETITPDKWFAAFSLPVRDLRLLATASQKSIAYPVVTPPPAPILVWIVDQSDGKPDFDLTSLADVGDTITIQIWTGPGRTGTLIATYTDTLDAGEVGAEIVDVTTTILPNGTYYASAYITINGIDSPWSNEETLTIVATGTDLPVGEVDDHTCVAVPRSVGHTASSRSASNTAYPRSIGYPAEDREC